MPGAGDSVGRMSDLTVPMALDPGFDPRSDVFNRLLKNRVIMLGTDVNDDLLRLRSDKAKLRRQGS